MASDNSAKGVLDAQFQNHIPGPSSGNGDKSGNSKMNIRDMMMHGLPDRKRKAQDWTRVMACSG